MDFVAVVDQVIALLRQWGRVTYRTLQRQFPPNDARHCDHSDHGAWFSWHRPSSGLGVSHDEDDGPVARLTRARRPLPGRDTRVPSA